MPPTSKLALVTPLAVLAIVALPAAGAAQYRLPTITAVAKADSLHDAAEHVAQTTRRWRDAASMHRQSATLRSPEDSLGYRCLTVAAHLSFAIKDLAGAQRDMTDAAAQAIGRGDVQSAAQAYTDAAWVARERNHKSEVWELGRQAEVLATSPLLSPGQRRDILHRFVRSEREYAEARQ